MDERILKIILRFGERYWTDDGVRTKATFRENGEHWRTALDYFLVGYAFERLGGFQSYVRASQVSLGRYEPAIPGIDFEDHMWNEFRQEVSKPNSKVNPLRPNGEGNTASLSRLVCEIPSHNIIKWTRDQILGGDAQIAYDKLHAVRGIGDKIASFFMRDVSVAFEIQSGLLQPAKCFLPIDVWTERGAKALAELLGIEGPTTPNQYRDAIIMATETAGLSASAALLINTGLWYMGTSTQLHPDEYQRCLADYEQLCEKIGFWIDRSESDAKYYRHLLEV